MSSFKASFKAEQSMFVRIGSCLRFVFCLLWYIFLRSSNVRVLEALMGEFSFPVSW